MIWHIGIWKNSLCYFLKSNAKALLAQASKVHAPYGVADARKITYCKENPHML